MSEYDAIIDLSETLGTVLSRNSGLLDHDSFDQRCNTDFVMVRGPDTPNGQDILFQIDNFYIENDPELRSYGEIDHEVPKAWMSVEINGKIGWVKIVNCEQVANHYNEEIYNTLEAAYEDQCRAAERERSIANEISVLSGKGMVKR